MRIRQCRRHPPEASGGYDFWRCQKRRWHDVAWPWQDKTLVYPDRTHRYNNYIWSGESQVHFQPVPVDVRWKA